MDTPRFTLQVDRIMNQPAPDDRLPTATIADRVTEGIDLQTGVCTMIFKNPDAKNFALSFDVKLLVVINKMCGFLLNQWHKTWPEKGVFNREAGEVSVSVFNDRRGVIAIQFDGDIAHIVPVDTALKLIDLMEQMIDKISTEQEKAERRQRKHPLIVQPRSRIITP